MQNERVIRVTVRKPDDEHHRHLLQYNTAGAETGLILPADLDAATLPSDLIEKASWWDAAMKGEAGKLRERVLEGDGECDDWYPNVDALDQLVAIASRPTGFTAEQVMGMVREAIAEVESRQSGKHSDYSALALSMIQSIIKSRLASAKQEPPAKPIPDGLPPPDSIDVGAGFERLKVGTEIEEGDEYWCWQKWNKAKVFSMAVDGSAAFRRKLPAPAQDSPSPAQASERAMQLLQNYRYSGYSNNDSTLDTNRDAICSFIASLESSLAESRKQAESNAGLAGLAVELAEAVHAEHAAVGSLEILRNAERIQWAIGAKSRVVSIIAHITAQKGEKR